ncbi:MAG: hypothetical protein AABW51_04380 [Nanoarchaeota archaeon]
MDLGRLVFMDEETKKFSKQLEILPDEVIGIKRIILEKELSKDGKSLCEVTLKRCFNEVEVYTLSNPFQKGVNLNVSYIGSDYGKKIDFKEPGVRRMLKEVKALYPLIIMGFIIY